MDWTILLIMCHPPYSPDLVLHLHRITSNCHYVVKESGENDDSDWYVEKDDKRSVGLCTLEIELRRQNSTDAM